uniref:Chromo domain-containing protein n=1 Tax=Strongyloides papillosus TaxID=174720 RepID=A0A0N5C1X0_STREA
MDEVTRSITRIFDKRIVNNKVEYMVAFRGLHIGLSEWVPEEQLKECQNEIDYYEAKIKGIKRPDRILQFSKFANDIDLFRNSEPKEKAYYKANQFKDECESDSDYEELKTDYLEALKEMELEEEKKQLYGEDACLTSNFGESNKFLKQKDAGKVKIILSNGDESEGHSTCNENGSACDGTDKDSFFGLFTSASDSDEDTFVCSESDDGFLGFMTPKKRACLKKKSACNGFGNESDDGTISIKSESADEVPVCGESGKEILDDKLPTKNDSAKNTPVCGESDKESLCNRLPTINESAKNTPACGESDKESVANKLQTVNESTRNTPLRSESDKESVANKLQTVNESARNTPLRSESDKESVVNKLSTVNESSINTPLRSESDKESLVNKLPTVNESAKNTPLRSESDKEGLVNKLPTVNEFPKSTPVRSESDKESLGSKSSTTYESAKDTPVVGESVEKCIYVGFIPASEFTKSTSVCGESDKQSLDNKISTTNKSDKSTSVCDESDEESTGSGESTANESAKDTSDCEESDEEEGGSKSSTVSESMFVSVSSGDEIEEPGKDESEITVPDTVEEPVCPRMTRSLSRRLSRKLSSSSEGNEIDARETSTAPSCTSTGGSSLGVRRSTRNRSRINFNESDSDDQIGEIKKQKTFIDDFVKPMPFSYVVEEDNFLTFVETYSLAGRKFVIYLTRDNQYLMIDERQVPSEFFDDYLDFLEKKGISYFP